MRPDKRTAILGLDGTIDLDVSCLRCEYNLRGLPPDGRCPECGTQLSELLDSLLCLADTGWLARLVWGVRLALWTIGTIAAGVIVSTVLLFLSDFVPTLDAVMCLAVLVTLATCALALSSLLHLTSAEPRLTDREAYITLRRCVRLLGVVGIGAGASLYFVTFFLIADAEGPSARLLIMTGLAELCGVVAFLGSLVLLRRWARRIPNRRLSRSTTVVTWGFGVTAGVIVAEALLIVFLLTTPTLGTPVTVTTMPAATEPAVQVEEYSLTAPATAPATTTSPAAVPPTGFPPIVNVLPYVATALVCACFLAVIVFGLWYVRLLWHYRNAMTQVLAQARVLAAADTDE